MPIATPRMPPPIAIVTGLANRTSLLHRLQQLLDRFRAESRRGFAVLLMDIDRFRTITDSLGPLVGDRLLVAMAARLEACLAEGEVLVRMGGDEFALLLEELPNPGRSAEAAERVQSALARPFLLDGHEVVITASIGVVVAGPAYDRPEALLRDADTAMTARKRSAAPATSSSTRPCTAMPSTRSSWKWRSAARWPETSCESTTNRSCH